MLATATSQRAPVSSMRGGYLLQTHADSFHCHLQFVSAREQDARYILLFGDPPTAGTRISDRRRYRKPIVEALPGAALHRRRSP